MADFTRVTGRLFTGAAISDIADVAALVTSGVTHIIDCRAEYDDGPLLASSGRVYLWNGTEDDGQPKPVAWFGSALAFAMEALAKPGTMIYAHCAAGVNRGPSMCYAIMRAQGWGANEALARLRSRRPVCANGVRYAPDAEVAIAALGYPTEVA